MQLSIHSFLLQKSGLESYECEDSIGIGAGANRFCIADGATEGFGSRRWSKLLTKHWVVSQGLLETECFTQWGVRLGQRFNRYWQRKKLPWYAEEKALKGAFAAFAGIALFERESGMQWQGIAQGDCCIFQFRADMLTCAFPLQDSGQFNNNPILISSDSTCWTKQNDHLLTRKGNIEKGDRFLLMSDAIAAWFLNALHHDYGKIPAFFAALTHGDHKELRLFIDLERNDKQLKNDDIAIILISVAGLG